MVKFKISLLFFLIFVTIFLFFYNKNIINKLDDLTSLESQIFQNGDIIENVGALEEYINEVITNKTLKNYEIVNNKNSLLVSIESEKISTLLNILYNVETHSIFHVNELNIKKNTLYKMNFTVENL